MTTTPKEKERSPNSSNPPIDYRDGLGKEIPASAFENEPGEPGNVEDTVSADDLADFDAETARLKAVIDY